MFRTKERQQQILDAIKENELAYDNLSTEVAAVKELLLDLDIDHILATMEHFILSANYISEILQTASVDDKDCCPNLNGE